MFDLTTGVAGRSLVDWRKRLLHVSSHW